MKTKEIKVGNINEWLEENPEVANTIIEKNSYINVNFDGWYDLIFKAFCNSASLLGFNIKEEDILFSGFYSQGDGASFTGSVDILDYLKATKQLTKYRPLVNAIKDDKVEESVSIIRNSYHYFHENTCSLGSIGIQDDISEKVKVLLRDLEEELESKRKELSIELYQELENANNRLCSRDSVIETLVANEYEFDEFGNFA